MAIAIGIAAPFVPAIVGFLRAGIPDVLFSGDAAALELGTLHAARSVQYLGPYSRFGWNHPGPLFFYLAMPLYEVLGQRGPALNLFALVSNLLVSMAIVVSALRLHGRALALSLVGLLAVFDLVAAPYLLTNEWNPIWPMLWFGLFTLLAGRLALGVRSVLPAMAFVASLIVQTHVGYALEVVVIAAFAGIRGGVFRRERDSRAWTGIAAAVLLVCWSLPIVEAVTTTPGNLKRLAVFFAPTPRHLAQQPWSTAFATVAGQLATAPWAVFETLTQRDLSSPGVAMAASLASVQVLCLFIARVRARRRHDEALLRLCEVILLEVAVAVVSVRAIRGDAEFYLVAWCSLIGLLGLALTTTAIVAETDWPHPSATGMAILATLAITGLALRAPAPRGPVFMPAASDARETALAVADFLLARPNDVPVVSIVSPDRWPVAVSAVLHLYKRNIPVRVDEQWLHIVGRQFAAPPGPHSHLLFADESFAATASQSGLVLVSTTQEVTVFYSPTD